MGNITKRRVAASSVVAAAVVGTAAITGVAAAEPEGHVLRLVAHETASTQTSRTTFASADTDRRDGKVIGYDTVSGRFDFKAQIVRIDGAAALKGGMIFFHVTQAATSNSFRGIITGGTRDYKGIEGTLTGHSPSQNSPDKYVTLRYHF
jgi:hypothetical protein